MINMTVKARNHAVVFDTDGTRIPEDRFVTVPMSPGLIRAVKDGDLEEVEQSQQHGMASPIYRRRPRQIAEPPPSV